MTEVKKAACKPRYKKELSIFEEETIEKLKDFRAARSKWINSFTDETDPDDSSKDFYQSNEYKGRYAFLRRKWFKTYLNVHYKTLRPLRYYTLKQKLPEWSLTDMNSRSKAPPKKVFKAREDVKIRSTKSDKKCARKDSLVDEKCKKKKKPKRNESDLFLRALCPSKKAIKKLKAAKLENRMIESCRCDDGKELTVVIKGVCLCDKTSLNKFKLNKLCNEYTKLENKNAELTEPIFPQVDSLEMIKKKMSRYKDESLSKENNQDEKEISLSKSENKKIKFSGNKQIIKVNHKVKTNKKDKYLQELGNTGTKPKNMSTTEPEENKANTNKLNLAEKDDQKYKMTNAFESQSKSNLRFEEEKDSTDLKERIEKDRENESTLTLYQNRPQEQSNIGLTEEQFDKMKNVDQNK